MSKPIEKDFRLTTKADMTAERARQLFDYDPVTGVITVKFGACKGRPARIGVRGYVEVKVDDIGYSGHRIAWLIQTGSWPNGLIDHINRDRADNRWENLREANKSINGQNAPATSSSGFKGVTRYHRRFKAAIRIGGRTVLLGSFPTAQEAAAAYDAAALKTYGPHACTNASLGLLKATAGGSQ